MYYGARFYDPVLSNFVSADNIAPSAGDPKSRNRYSYVASNPMRNTDPSGHSPEDMSGAMHDVLQDLVAGGGAHTMDNSDRSDYDKCSRGSRAACEAEVRNLGITLGDGWDLVNKLWELQAILKGLHLLMVKAGWNYTDFQYAMGISQGVNVVIQRGGGNGNTFAETSYDSGFLGLGQRRATITFYDIAFKQSGDYGDAVTTAGANAVHEFAHAWDFAHDGRETSALVRMTGGGYDPWPLGAYRPGGTTTSGYGATSAREDWAETVAAAVYPDAPRYSQDPDHQPSDYRARMLYVKTRFDDVREHRSGR